MKKLLIIFLLIPFQLFAQHWYVDNTGTEDTLATIAEVNALTPSSGDTISFKCGCVWREALDVPGSGLTFNKYGTGDNPEILGAIADSGWDNHSGNIWRTGTFNDPSNIGGYPTQPFIIELDDSVKWMKKVSSNIADLDSVYDWYWQNDSIYAYFIGDPNTVINHAEIPFEDMVFDVGGVDSIEINGIDMFYCSWALITENAGVGDSDRVNLVIRNCEFAYTGAKDNVGGLASQGRAIQIHHSNVLIDNCYIHDHGRNGVALPYFDNAHDVIIQHCNFYKNYHNIAFGINVNGNSVFNNLIFRNNVIHHNPSEDCIEPESYTVVGIAIYNGTTRETSMDSIFIL